MASAPRATARPTPNIAKARQALGEKLERLEREARAEDEKQRMAIVKAGMAGEAKAKAEFAAASRKIATMFDAARDTVNSEYATGKTQAAADPRLGPEKGRPEKRREKQADRR